MVNKVPEADGNVVLFPASRDRRDGTGETRRTLSWIWTGESNRVNGQGNGAEGNDLEENDGTSEEGSDADGDCDDSSNKADNEILRVEWSKSRARCMRATEEVALVKEEMRRALAYLEWKAGWWEEKENGQTGVSGDMLEAIMSFAKSQAQIQTSLADHFRRLWQSPLSNLVPGENTTTDENKDDSSDKEAEGVPIDENDDEEL